MNRRHLLIAGSTGVLLGAGGCIDTHEVAGDNGEDSHKVAGDNGEDWPPEVNGEEPEIPPGEKTQYG